MYSHEDYPIYEDAAVASFDLLLNRETEKREEGFYSGLTPPSRNSWYRGRAFDWDHMKHIIDYSREGSPESLIAAETEYLAVYAGQTESGKVPNQRHLYGRRTVEANLTGSTEANFYSQPAMGSIGGLEFYRSMRKISPEAADDFIFFIHGNLAGEALYWPLNRSNGPKDYRLGVVAGEETGMDESPIFDHQLPFRRLRRSGRETPMRINLANMAIHFAGRLLLDRQRHGLTDDEAGIKKAREMFWVMPVQIQAIATANLYSLARLSKNLGKYDEADEFDRYARNIELQVLNDVYDPDSPGMWDQNARGGKGMFRDLDRDGKPIDAVDRYGNVTEETTVSSLMALLFPNIREHQLASSVEMALEEFMGEYGLSTVSSRSPNYDPDHGEKESGRWRGPSWLDQAWMLAEGLTMQINREDISEEVKERCVHLLSLLNETTQRTLNKWTDEGTPTPEYYSHRSGKAFRLYRVQWFAWNKLGHVMPPDTRTSVFAEALLDGNLSESADFDLAA